MHLTRRPAVSLAAATVAAALLLAGCGGGDGDGKSRKIEGADDAGKKSSQPGPGESEDDSKSKEPDFRTSDIKLPDDLKMVFDWEQPSDPDKAAALDGAADYMRAMNHGSVKQDPKDPVLAQHVVPLQTAEEAATKKIKLDTKAGYTVTGTERFSHAKIGDVVDSKLVEVSFCMNQREFFSKEIKTGKVRRTKESDEDYLRIALVMQKPEKPRQVWKARSLEFKGEGKRLCES
ncbi:hypothetical protein [Streptomyces spirodelae]|uniref:Lipoprotein n=1 Tax=Streptomyces spirodelae TaxID=2812904 RepID=A0ABS3WNU6_9ACTN|nr:hypothetical protein [Streptomyces spirodelae]MBO8184780.1 hypothetical protein [Streptomyces spirodelae]